MSKLSREMKRIQERQNAEETLGELKRTTVNLDDNISGLMQEAKETLEDNNEEGYQLIANSIFYFQDLRNMVNTIRIQYQTYLRTANVMDSIEGIRVALKSIAKQMDKYPSIAKNNRDFNKFKRSLVKGQLNMKAMTGIMRNINPAASQYRSKDEYNALRERVMVGSTQKITDGMTDTQSMSNQEFFDKING